MWSGDITDTQEGILFEVFFSEHACVILIGYRVASCCTVCSFDVYPTQLPTHTPEGLHWFAHTLGFMSEYPVYLYSLPAHVDSCSHV